LALERKIRLMRFMRLIGVQTLSWSWLVRGAETLTSP
jgi:hypothetical protein